MNYNFYLNYYKCIRKNEKLTADLNEISVYMCV